MELGSGLAAAGVTVISGLALGIDGAAHRGALAADGAPVVGVVGSGLDVVYPRGNRDLWEAVSAAGTLLAEAPLGAEPEGWRFPARNRLLAALADVVVVVESKRAGGSMHTVEEAIRREVTVMAVPGSVRNPAAEGTNLLLSEGCAPACSTDDVLVALELATAGPASGRKPPFDLSRRVQAENAISGIELDSLQKKLFDLLDDGPVSLDTLVLRAGVLVARGLDPRRRCLVAGRRSLAGASGGQARPRRRPRPAGLIAPGQSSSHITYRVPWAPDLLVNIRKTADWCG